MLRIIHRVQDGAVSERLVSLDGSGREFIRTGARAHVLPAGQAHGARRAPPGRRIRCSAISQPSTTRRRASTTSSEVARTRLNRRDTRVIPVTPKDEFRYGYRLWIDETTAMPLKTQLCDAHGHVIEQMVFASLTLVLAHSRLRLQAGRVHRGLPVAADRDAGAAEGTASPSRLARLERAEAAPGLPDDRPLGAGHAGLQRPGRSPRIHGRAGLGLGVRRDAPVTAESRQAVSAEESAPSAPPRPSRPSSTDTRSPRWRGAPATVRFIARLACKRRARPAASRVAPALGAVAV